MNWIDFNTEMPKEGQHIIVAEKAYGAFSVHFKYDKWEDYSNSKWCPWPF